MLIGTTSVDNIVAIAISSSLVIAVGSRLRGNGEDCLDNTLVPMVGYHIAMVN
jgi:hypothetical protein